MSKEHKKWQICQIKRRNLKFKKKRTFGHFAFACGYKLLHRQYVLNLNNKSYDVSHLQSIASFDGFA